MAILITLVVVFAISALMRLANAGEVAPEPDMTTARSLSDHCVADTGFMRRNHMKMLIHQRRETVHEGIRTTRFSLKGCIACHAVPGDDGKPVTIASPQHFCRTCHDFAAVKVDCFECHASVPEKGDSEARVSVSHGNAGGQGDVAALADYLGRVKR